MTTFQDPPPQSRRAVRQSERGETDQVAYPPFTQTPQAQPWQAGDQREMWDTTQRRAAQLPTTPPVPAAPTSGRRAAPPLPEAEPLTYTTQGRPPVPSYDGPFRNEPAPVVEPAPTQALPAQDQPTYRVRDFAPASFSPAPTWTQEPAAPSDLDYQTQARLAPVTPLPVEAVPAVAAEPPVAAPASVPPEQTLTRRELRAMLQAESMPEEAISEYVAPVTVLPVAAAPAPVAAAPVDAAEEKAWPFAFGGEPEVATPVAAAPIAPVAVAPVAEAPVVAPVASAPIVATPDDGARALFGDIMTPLSAPLPAVAPEVTPNTGLVNALSEFDALASAQPVAAPVAEVAAPETPQPTWTRPIGHWSTQAELDDETQPYESTINRKVGSGHTTTNALVLPTIPDHDIRGALTGGGDIMLTGSIDLPASLAVRGTTDRHDHDGLDALFEGGEHELVPTDSQPVRAVRAVSTHTTGQGVTHTQKPKGNRVLTGLLIAASAMAVVGVGLLVAVVIMNLR